MGMGGGGGGFLVVFGQLALKTSPPKGMALAAVD